jgi:mycothiol synthase
VSEPVVYDGADLPPAARNALLQLPGIDAEHLLCHGAQVAILGPVDQPVAAAVAVPTTGGWSVDTSARQPGRDLTLATELGARLPGEGPVHLWLSSNTPGLVAAADDGRLPVRTVLELRVPLPLDPPRIEVRPFRPMDDAEAWVRVNNRAFAWHPEQGGWKQEDLARRTSEPWFDPRGFLIHEIDGTLAGFCWTKIHRQPEDLGEIYVIGVDPELQGRGLGRQLTLAGFHHLHERGMPTGMLWVEGDNEAALALYADLGMREHSRRRALVLKR